MHLHTKSHPILQRERELVELAKLAKISMNI